MLKGIKFVRLPKKKKMNFFVRNKISVNWFPVHERFTTVSVALIKCDTLDYLSWHHTSLNVTISVYMWLFLLSTVSTLRYATWFKCCYRFFFSLSPFVLCSNAHFQTEYRSLMQLLLRRIWIDRWCGTSFGFWRDSKTGLIAKHMYTYRSTNCYHRSIHILSTRPNWMHARVQAWLWNANYSEPVPFYCKCVIDAKQMSYN